MPVPACHVTHVYQNFRPNNREKTSTKTFLIAIQQNLCSTWVHTNLNKHLSRGNLRQICSREKHNRRTFCKRCGVVWDYRWSTWLNALRRWKHLIIGIAKLKSETVSLLTTAKADAREFFWSGRMVLAFIDCWPRTKSNFTFSFV